MSSGSKDYNVDSWRKEYQNRIEGMEKFKAAAEKDRKKLELEEHLLPKKQ